MVGMKGSGKILLIIIALVLLVCLPVVVWLLLRPDEPDVAQISGTLSVHVMATTKERAQVVLEASSYYALGWSPQESINEQSRMAMAPRVRIGRAWSQAGTALVCERDARVFVAMGEDVFEVGRIPNNTPFRLAGARPKGIDFAFTPIQEPVPWLDLAPGAHLLIDADVVPSCRAAPP